MAYIDHRDTYVVTRAMDQDGITSAIQYVDGFEIEATAANNDFIFKVTVVAGNLSFTFPIACGGTHICHVDWGDSTSNDYTAAPISHTYTSAGTYTISVSGTFRGWSFGVLSTDNHKIVEIVNWGIFNPMSYTRAFEDCDNLIITATDELDLSGVTTMESFFSGCSSITTIPNIGTWDLSSVTSLADMFRSCELFNDDIGSWDVSSVEDISYMFYFAKAFNQDLDQWDVSSVTDMTSCFHVATSFNGDISTWDTSAVTNMYRMFYGTFFTKTIFNQDISGWDTSLVTDMRQMVYYNDYFDQDISGWDITSVNTGITIDGNLSTSNYDALLIAWEAQSVQNGVVLQVGSTKYTGGGTAATAKAALIADHSWSISDGGTV